MQAYPNRPIRLIVPFPADGPTDVTARLLARRLGQSLGQPVMVDNRPGAHGLIGCEMAAKAPCDGYTLLMGSIGTMGINPGLYPKLPYDALRDFAPVSLLDTMPLLLVVHPSLPVRSVADLVAYARSQPGKLSYASSGSGSASHMAGLLFKQRAGADIVHVPYQGSQPALSDVLVGKVALVFSAALTSMPPVRDGRLRALGVTSRKRLDVLPDVPTLAEEGLPGIEIGLWYGLFAPAGTARAIIERLAEEVSAVMRHPEVVKRLHEHGVEAVGNAPDVFAAFLREEIARWGALIQANGESQNQ